MCGITGYIGKREAFKILIAGLKILQNRGYDSTGILTLNSNSKILSKYASQKTGDAIEKLKADEKKHINNHIGIGHTRWATHGAKTQNNAHPHHDQNERIYVVHNGIIENYNKIKKKLIKCGINFRSQTDTEVIAQLIGYYAKEMDILKSIKKAISELEGTWGLAIVDIKNPEQIIVARKGSPMLIGIGNEETFIASESAAFAKYTQHFISLNNDEIAIVSADGCNLDLSRIEKTTNEQISISPHPYQHWTIKEIYDQPNVIKAALNNGGRIDGYDKVKLGGLDDNIDCLVNIRHLILTGCGTSYYASLYASEIMKMFKIFETVRVIDSSELTSNDFNCNDLGLLAVSQSGETNDVLRSLELASKSECNIIKFSVVNRVGSLIARTTACGVYLNAGRENAVASTKAFTSQIVVLTLIAIWFAQRKNKYRELRCSLINNLLKLSPCYSSTLSSVSSNCDLVAKKLYNSKRCFILGKNLAEAIAKEGALKIKEITYLHAEGFAAGSLKHGPFALIENGTPVILILLDDSSKSYIETTISEVKSRGAFTVVITNCPSTNLEKLIDISIHIPQNGNLSALLAILPLQLIAYKLSVLKGINPDKPRNLAKTVTVI